MNPKLPEDFDRGSPHSGSHRCTHFEWDNQGKLRFSHSGNILKVVWGHCRIKVLTLFLFKDVPGLPNYVKSLGTHLFQMQGTVIVFDASKGISITGKNHYYLFKHATSGNNHRLVVPLVNLTSTDNEENEELKQLALDELGEFMTPEELSNAVIGSVQSDSTIKTLVERLTKLYDPSVLQTESTQLSKLPLYWPLENVGDIPNRYL
jgi:translation elongation factor EF-Tu-like GTPase